jgi:hypothetical protein
VKPDRRVILVKGTSLLSPFSANLGAGTPQVSIIGQNNPIILVGAASAGIELITGNLYLRGLTVQGAGNGAVSPNGPGIQVDSAASFIGLDRCRILGNAGGLLVNAGVSFDIANSVFASNVSKQIGATTTVFGGVYLGGPASSQVLSQNRFWFNTVVQNSDRGVVCADANQLLTGMLMHGNQGDFLNCVIDGTSAWESGTPTPNPAVTTSFVTDPALDSTYHLTANSPKPCKDYITATATNHPFDDMDGDPRPNPANGKLDCGADEF